VVFVFLLLPRAALSASSEKPSDASLLLAKAQTLIDLASKSPTSGASSVPLYDEPLKLLEEITSRYHRVGTITSQTEKLKAICHDHQAKYAEEHQSLKMYANLVSNGDKEKASVLLKGAADGLLEALEMTEAVMLFHIVSDEYQNTKAAPEAILKTARVLEEDGERGSGLEVVAQYEKLMARYPQNIQRANVCMAMAEICGRYDHLHNKVLDLANEFLSRFSESEVTEDMFHRLSQMLNRGEDRPLETTIISRCLELYPNGAYAAFFRKELSALQRSGRVQDEH